MSIVRFKGRTTAAGVNTQRQNAPQFRTQFSGYKRSGDDGATYPVYNPGAVQTATREPNPEPPQAPPFPPTVRQEGLMIIARTYWKYDPPASFIHLAIPQWNRFLLNHSLAPFATPPDFIPPRTDMILPILFEIGGSSNRCLVWIVGVPFGWRGFVVFKISQSAITPVNLIGSDRTGFEWLDEVYTDPSGVPNFNSPKFIQYNAERYRGLVFPSSLPSDVFNVPSPTKIGLEVDCTYPMRPQPTGVFNSRYFKYAENPYPYIYDQKLANVIRETGLRKFKTTINLPAYNLPPFPPGDITRGFLGFYHKIWLAE